LVGFYCVIACVIGVAFRVPSHIRACIAGSLCAAALIAVAALSRAPDAFRAGCVLVALLALGTALGAQIGLRVKRPGHLLFVALVSALADMWSVTQPGGVSQQIAAEPAALHWLAVSWPLLGTRDVVPLLGVGDIVFVALYLGATRAHQLSLARTLWALLAGFTLTTVCVLALELPIPVLPWLGICFVCAQPRARSIDDAEMRRGLWVLAALAGALAVWVLRRTL
jgi:hypothetical protein